MTGLGTISLGLVPSGRRYIKSGAEYDKFFDTDEVEGDEVELMADGDVYDTLRLMKKMVRTTLTQTEKIAQKLKGSSREETCRNIFNFIYNHIQYKKDNPMREQLRTPIRTWKDRRSGVDCDCYSIFISSILTNLKIPHAFRMAAYGGDWQHVYVVAGDYIIDPVVSRFNYETPYQKKHDTMSKVTMLNGPDDQRCTPVIQKLRRYTLESNILDAGLVPTDVLLKRNNIPFTSHVDQATGNGVISVSTPNGTVNLPTVLTLGQASSLIKPPVAEVTSQPQEEVKAAEVAKAKFPWWAVLIALGGFWLLTGEEQQEVKPGLSGAPKNTNHRAKRKLPVLHI